MRRAEKEEKTIDGIKFVVTRFHGKEAVKLHYFLVRNLGPSLGHIIGSLDGLLSGGGKKAGDMKFDGAELALAIEQLTDKLGGEDEYLDFLQRMFANAVAHIEDKKLHFSQITFYDSLDTVFGGSTLSIYKLLFFVLEVNYPDFLALILGGIGKRMQGMFTSGQEDEDTKNE